ncbi:FMN-linked oxidoreductase [Pseudovirgaria hyperparasitica]|uniref:FMN-linked oxidoreductase n=1 Tax=Pseudovirgaria hyperparasitica TaxID=470096 RepID=A0A6A6W844_9PEZI|nr:FMN-linked oxidoreductase [Pseudovirgaria hyperparasitica]KAF2759022.1 FMN-linked oxidoreductase [Pseudovirgaria hyperparasitica]
MSPKRYESEKVDPAPLGKTLNFEFSKRTARNRFMKAAMTERLSSWDPQDKASRGIPSKNLINVYKRWGEGEFGVILSGNIMIDYDQLEAMGNPIIPPDAPFSGERFEAQQEMAKAAKAHGSLFVGQVSHPGRQVENRINPNPISASDVQLEGNIMGMSFNKPREATQQDIDHVVESFAHAAEYLEKAGYDGIQLHGAHGYLLSQFLSPTTNQRTDKYGGSIENRARIIVEIAQAVQKRTKPDFSLSIKLNSVEFQDKGFSPEEAQKVVAILEQNKFDFVELSGGTYESLAFVHKRESTKKREAFFLDFAEMITPVLSKTKVYITGGLKTAGAMVKALESVDGVGLARPVTQEPTLPKDIIEGRVLGAIEQLPDQNDFGLTNVVAGSQIRQIGKDQTPIDMSQQSNLEGFKKDMATWGQGLASDEDLKKFGYVDIDTVTSTPYGTAAPSS